MEDGWEWKQGMDSMLCMVYEAVNSIQEITVEDFFDSMISGELWKLYGKPDKERFIRRIQERPRGLIQNFLSPIGRERIQKRLMQRLGGLEGKRRELQNKLEEEEKRLNFGKGGCLPGGLLDNADFEAGIYALLRTCLKEDRERADVERRERLERAKREFEERTVLAEPALTEACGENPYVCCQAADRYAEEWEKSQRESCLDQAYALYKKAAGWGLPEACWKAGRLAQKKLENRIESGIQNRTQDGTQDEGENWLAVMLRYYHQAADLEFGEAYRSLGALWENPALADLVKADLPYTSVECYKRAYESGSIGGAYDYGRALEAQLRRNRNERGYFEKEWQKKGKTMRRCFEMAAEKGNGAAMYRCALYYGRIEDETSLPADRMEEVWGKMDMKKSAFYRNQLIQFANLANPIDGSVQEEEQRGAFSLEIARLWGKGQGKESQGGRRKG